jgi:hypothetical protein
MSMEVSLSQLDRESESMASGREAASTCKEEASPAIPTLSLKTLASRAHALKSSDAPSQETSPRGRHYLAHLAASNKLQSREKPPKDESKGADRLQRGSAKEPAKADAIDGAGETSDLSQSSTRDELAGTRERGSGALKEQMRKRISTRKPASSVVSSGPDYHENTTARTIVCDETILF